MDEITLHEHALAESVRLVDEIQPDQEEHTTPCTEWDVRALVRHMTMANQQFARQAAGEATDFTATPAEFGTDLAGGFRRSAESLSAAWREPGRLTAELTIMGQPAPAGTILTWQLAEFLLHGWDLARATGQQPRYEPEAIAAVSAFVQANLPAERPPEFPFAPATQPPADASALDRLAALTGREV